MRLESVLKRLQCALRGDRDEHDVILLGFVRVDLRSSRIEGMTATCFVPLCVLLIGDAMEFISNRFTGSFFFTPFCYYWRAVEILLWSSSQVLTLCPQRYGFAGSCRWRSDIHA